MENMVNTKLFNGIFNNKKILITGDTGFKGSWLSLILLHLGAKVYGYSLEPNHPNDNFTTCELFKYIEHKTGDIRDLVALRQFVNDVKPDYAFHMAAQPLVIDSYKNPVYTFETNVMGVVNFFEAMRTSLSTKVAINITSDKCYKNNEWIWGYREDDPMGGRDPYSASKSCSEIITHSYFKSFFESTGCLVASVRAGNVIGGGDWSENRIVPDIFRAIFEKQKIQIRNPHATRPWQFVLEPLFGYLSLCNALATKGANFAGGWNFGPLSSSEKNVEELVIAILNMSNEGSYEIVSPKNEFHEANYLKLDISKAISQLRWTPMLSFEQTIQFTVDGYFAEKNTNSIYEARLCQIEKYANLYEQSL
jgi:CDP-glucose 4,6-dehydratase